MADLKPLGSEKLQGMDKIQRILEIARFKETIPTPVNETSRNEYKLTLADGNEYQIVREKSGYIIKQSLTESTTDYIEPMKNRKYYSSYSQALRRLNLMAKEMNEIHENTEGISLFGEQKKFVLKTPEKKNTNPTDDVENVPAPPAPSPASAPAPEASAPAPELPAPPSEDEMPMGDEMPADDMDMGGDEGTTEPVGDDDHDEEVTFKTIQKLTGKLGQKLRTLNSDEENEMSSKDIKYVINSILSALDLENLDENDREDITNKIEGTEPDTDFDFGKEDEPMDDEEPTGDESIGGDDMGADTEPVGFGEMDETWDELGTDIASNTMMRGMMPGVGKEMGEADDDTHIKNIADSVFMESKVEDLLMGYFTITENEKKFNKEVGKQRLIERKTQKSNRNLEIKRLSESLDQEIASRRFLEENKKASFVGKTNKKNLVFEFNNKQFKITPKGNIIWFA